MGICMLSPQQGPEAQPLVSESTGRLKAVWQSFTVLALKFLIFFEYVY